MINILIADDHVLIREGLKKILKTEPDMTVAGEARDSLELYSQVRACNPSIVLLDISMPGESGLDALKTLKQNHPRLPVLILSVHPEQRFAIRALKAGASGYLTKDTAVEELVTAIRRTVAGGKYVSVALAEKLASQLDNATGRPPHENLSDREFQIMCMIASGKKRTEIAEELSLSLSTVNTYRARVLEKMNMQSNVELARYAMEHGLVE